MKRGRARPPLRVGGTPPAMRAESGRRACCSANSVSCAAVSTDTWQRRMGRNIAARCAAGPIIKSAVPAWGDRDCLTACIRGPENTRRRNYNRAGVMRGGMPYVRLHARRAAPTEPPSITLAKVFLQKSLRIGRRAFRPRLLAAPVSIPGFARRFQSRCARRQRRRTCSTARATARRHARDACAVVACAISGAAPDTRLASVVATVLA